MSFYVGTDLYYLFIMLLLLISVANTFPVFRVEMSILFLCMLLTNCHMFIRNYTVQFLSMIFATHSFLDSVDSHFHSVYMLFLTLPTY